MGREPFWAQKIKEEMKYSKKILKIWIGVVAVIAFSWGAALHDNARQGHVRAKEIAVQTLRRVAERVVNREFDELGESYSSFVNHSKKHTKRKAMSETGILEVGIDSLKEAQGLYPLDFVGIKADMLNCRGEFPLEKICAEWKGEMDVRYGRVVCALSLEAHPWYKKNVRQKMSVGDTTIVVPPYDLGTYYLDGLYTMKLTAYMQLPAWCCIDGRDTLLQVLSALFLFVGMAGLAVYARHRMHKKKEKTMEQTIAYWFGEYMFDLINHTLTYQENCVMCKPQAAKLLLGFAKSTDLFLANDEIATICGWPLTDSNLDGRRRKAISLLNKLFDADDSVQICPTSGKEGYQMIIS